VKDVNLEVILSRIDAAAPIRVAKVHIQAFRWGWEAE